MHLGCKRLLIVLALLLFPFINIAFADEWAQWLGPKRDGVWRETGIVKEFPVGGPPVRWRTKIGGGYSGPAVAGKHVFVTDKQSPEESSDSDGSRRETTERVLCLNDDDGSIIWKHEYECRYTVSYPAGPRTTPVIQDGRVYTLGAEGHLFCLNEADGAVIWSKNFQTDYGRKKPPVWGYSSNLLLDGDRLICLVGGKGQTVVALHKDTGKELWRALDSETEHGPGYGSPIIIEAGGTRQLIVWHPSALSSLDPETGKTFWEEPFTSTYGMSVATPRFTDNKLLISALYDGALLMNLDPMEPKANVVWRRKGKNERDTDALHCVISTPMIDGNSIYGVCSYGDLRGLDLTTGNRLWSTLEPTSKISARWGSAFIVKQEDRYFLFSEQGDMIIAKLSPDGYEEVSRAHLLEPTGPAQRRQVVWTHPAFAHRNIYLRNDREIISVSAAENASK